MSHFIDRRLNDRKKSSVNRQRFIRRYKKQLQRSMGDLIAGRGVTDMAEGGEVSIPSQDISEPRFGIGQGGNREFVHPGNKEFNPGDKIQRPPGSGGGQGDGAGDGDGNGEDNFAFSLSREEFLNLFFEDMELPHLIKTTLSDMSRPKLQRAGYTSSGSPTNLSVPQSLQKAMARRIALKAPLKRELAELKSASDDSSANKAQIEALEKRIDGVPFIDEFDLRFRHRVKVPQPISRAVMFCLMDVSASMQEKQKDLAKRFYTLLYLFLTQKYEKVELVFIRHTDNAEEVDEHTFFNDRKTGGTIVLAALQLMHSIIEARYPSSDWNIYGAQASDGDAFGADPGKSRSMLEKELLPLCRYYAYIEVPGAGDRLSPLQAAYQQIADKRFAMQEVHSRADVYPVLRQLFQKELA